MRLLAHTSLLAIALAAVSAGQSARGQDVPTATPTPSPTPFRLPPRATPTPTDVQGPVDPDAPILTRPRTPTPTPRPVATAAPTPTPTPAPRPAPTPTARSTRAPNSTLPPRFTPPAAPTPQESADAVADSADLFPGATAPAPAPQTTSLAPAPAQAAPADEDGSGAGWLFALLGVLAAGGVAAALWWRKRRTEGPVEVAAIERPRVGPAPATPAAVPLPETGAPLLIEARAVKLSRSMVFATLAYELTVVNRSGRALENVRFGGDLVTAHARVPTTQQLADPAMPLAPMQDIARLEPGESAQLSGELRLPVNEIRPIPHGKAVVYVPLLRVRAEAAGMHPIARTFVVGLVPPGTGQRLQPFRLDEMPQTYSMVGQKALD